MRLLTLFAACTLTIGLPADSSLPGQASRTDGDLDRVVEQRMKNAGIPGLGAALIVDKKVVWMKGYGFADRTRRVPFTPDTVMNIGSISKTFTGAALMRAVQDGKLILDADINDYLPFRVINPYYPNERVTLRQLGIHTSGISDRWAAYQDSYRYGGAAEPLGEFLKSYFLPGGARYSKDNFLNVMPGTHREYSNMGAALAGYIVERATGETLSRYTTRHFFAPLRMRNTGWSLSEVPRGNHAQLYVVQDGITIPISLYELTTYPDGGVRTSVSDLSRFFIALLNSGEYEGTRILDAKSVEEMVRFQYTESSKPDNVNLNGEDSVNAGIFWGTRFDVTRIGHNGSDPGVRTMMLADLAKRIGVVLFANASVSGEGMRHYAAIFLEFWNHAESLKN